MTSPEPILPRVAAGEPDAFQECVDRYKSLVWWLARKWVGDNADDATQEIFLNVWRNAHRYDATKASESTFVSLIARRRLIDLCRRTGRIPALEPIEEQTSLVGQLPESIEAQADVVLTRRVIDEQLNEKERNVLSLSLHEGMSHSEIARCLDLPLGTVKTYLRRSLQKVRACLDTHAVTPEEATS